MVLVSVGGGQVSTGKTWVLTTQNPVRKGKKVLLDIQVRGKRFFKYSQTRAHTHAPDILWGLTCLPLTTTRQESNLTNWHGIWLNRNITRRRASETETQMNTKSAKLNGLINLATDLGLLVEIDDRSNDYSDRYTIRIRRNFNGEANLLEQMYKHEELIIVASRYSGDNKPRAFKTLNTYCYFLTSSSDIKPSHLAIRIKMMAEDLTRYQTKTAA